MPGKDYVSELAYFKDKDVATNLPCVLLLQSACVPRPHQQSVLLAAPRPQQENRPFAVHAPSIAKLLNKQQQRTLFGGMIFRAFINAQQGTRR